MSIIFHLRFREPIAAKLHGHRLRLAERFHHFNTHFPYRSVEQEARRRTVKLIQQRIACLNPVLLTADFNSIAGEEIHGMLAENLQDAWAAAECRLGPEGTLNGFGRHSSSRRIDWILYRASWTVIEAETVAATRDGLYASDHFPVTAVFQLA